MVLLTLKTARLILLFGLICISLACSTSNPSNTNMGKEKEENTGLSNSEATKTEEEKSEPEKTEEDKPNIPDWATASSVSITCADAEYDLSTPLMEVASQLEAQQLMYNVQPFTDCSGIFHRVLDSINRRCPDHAFPNPNAYRSSRGVGKWYSEKGNFIQITDPENEWAYIKPGAVMFYASGSIDPKAIQKEALFKQGGIRHVGVVVAVEKDPDGVVSSYTLFHGRTTGKVAAMTNYHDREPSRNNYPPYGNGGDHWVGVAPIASDKLMD